MRSNCLSVFDSCAAGAGDPALAAVTIKILALNAFTARITGHLRSLGTRLDTPLLSLWRILSIMSSLEFIRLRQKVTCMTRLMAIVAPEFACGIDTNPTPLTIIDEIKRAYKKKAVRIHPVSALQDMCGTPFVTEFLLNDRTK